MKLAIALIAVAALGAPAYAWAQGSSGIVIQDTFGDFEKGDHLFIFGSITQPDANSFLILQVTNPDGDICNIQQLSPLSGGLFLTEKIPLQGRICGIVGPYDVSVFYGEHSASAKFSVSSDIRARPSQAEYLSAAQTLTESKIHSLEIDGGILPAYRERLNTASDVGLDAIRDVYVGLWTEITAPNQIYDVDPNFRPAVIASLDATTALFTAEKFSFSVANDIDAQIYQSVFYYEIGDKSRAIDLLNDVFISIENVDPVKPAKKALVYEDLEETVRGLMTKSGYILSRDLKEELGFIFARGTAPVYATELAEMLELLTEARYLDVVSRKDDKLYRLVQTDWGTLRESLLEKKSIDDFLSLEDKVSKLHEAALLLRSLDNVERFINADEASELAELIAYDWASLESKLRTASTADDILDARQEISDMKNVIDISERISKVVSISRSAQIDSGIVDGWEALLDELADAGSVSEMLVIVSEFDESINELREKRSPLSILRFEYERLRERANLQADHENILKINDGLRIIRTAEQIEAGSPTVSRIDRIEVLLVGVSEAVPEIWADLELYSKDVQKVRASDVLQRVKSVENLVQAGVHTKRFLPGYVEFAESINEKISNVRKLVIDGRLADADGVLDELFKEWKIVNEAYSENPHKTGGHSLDILKKVEFRERIEAMNIAVKNFYNTDFEPHADEYDEIADDASDLIDRNNYADAEKKLDEMGDFLRDHLELKNGNIVFETEYDRERGVWILSGYLNKTIDWRQNVYITVYENDATERNELKFTDTRAGEFLTRWHSPAEPGLYVILLEWQNVKASQIVYIPRIAEYEYTDRELSVIEAAREFEELESLIESFKGNSYDATKLGGIMRNVEVALGERDSREAGVKLAELKRAIERHLPERSREAVIEAQYDGSQIIFGGAVKKSLVYSEDLFIDLFDQKGKHINEIFIKDTPTGQFSTNFPVPLKPGVYVAQLDYHGMLVTDVFTVN